MPRIEFVCLANSRKHGGRCVAGIRTDGGGWVRLVSPAEGGTLTFFDYRIGERDEARPFDVIRAGVREYRPQPHQRENWVIDETPWELVQRPADRLRQDLVRSHVVFGPDLLGTTAVAIGYDELVRTAGMNPAARQSDPAARQSDPAARQSGPAARYSHESLAVVRPSRPVLAVDRTARGRLRLRVRFSLRGAGYDLMCTDPEWEAAAGNWRPGEHPWWQLAPYAATPLLVISLTEPFGEGRECYKIVATVLPGPEIVTHSIGPPASAATRHAPLSRHSANASPGLSAAGFRSRPR